MGTDLCPALWPAGPWAPADVAARVGEQVLQFARGGRGAVGAENQVAARRLGDPRASTAMPSRLVAAHLRQADRFLEGGLFFHQG